MIRTEQIEEAPARPFTPARPLRLCLAASGGGHLRQLLDLEPVWGKFDYYFVTEDTALGRSLAERHPVRFVNHYALGQARLGKPLTMLKAAIGNFFQSVRLILKDRPDVVITTGAGAVYWASITARLLGAKLVMIDSFARFDKPSKFARLTAPFAHHKVVQAAPLKQAWPDAQLFDPLRVLETPPPPKQKLLFATVGATLPFERLVDSVLALKASGALPHRVILQTGDDPRQLPQIEGVEIVRSLDFERVKQILEDSEIVVCHGGTGSLVTALRAGCKIMAMPRRFDLGEHYDDHQEEITSIFAARGLIEQVREADDLGPAIERWKDRKAVIATTDPDELIAWLDGRLEEWAAA